MAYAGGRVAASTLASMVRMVRSTCSLTLTSRRTRTRSAWTRQGLAALGLEGVPGRTNQDQRDAVAAAMTARQHTLTMTETIGEIVVPACRW